MILYSEGFESSKNLAKKMVQMYKLCSEQLSQQDHYDFGMRAVKSVLVMAGALKRQNPDKNEDVVLIRALRDSNLPKFLKQDASLFQVCPYLLTRLLHLLQTWWQYINRECILVTMAFYTIVNFKFESVIKLEMLSVLACINNWL